MPNSELQGRKNEIYYPKKINKTRFSKFLGLLPTTPDHIQRKCADRSPLAFWHTQSPQERGEKEKNGPQNDAMSSNFTRNELEFYTK